MGKERRRRCRDRAGERLAKLPRLGDCGVGDFGERDGWLPRGVVRTEQRRGVGIVEPRRLANQLGAQRRRELVEGSRGRSLAAGEVLPGGRNRAKALAEAAGRLAERPRDLRDLRGSKQRTHAFAPPSVTRFPMSAVQAPRLLCGSTSSSSAKIARTALAPPGTETLFSAWVAVLPRTCSQPLW